MIVSRSTINKLQEILLSFFCIIMSFPIPFDISQHNAEMLEEQ